MFVNGKKKKTATAKRSNGRAGADQSILARPLENVYFFACAMQYLHSRHSAPGERSRWDRLHPVRLHRYRVVCAKNGYVPAFLSVVELGPERENNRGTSLTTSTKSVSGVARFEHVSRDKPAGFERPSLEVCPSFNLRTRWPFHTFWMSAYSLLRVSPKPRTVYKNLPPSVGNGRGYARKSRWLTSVGRRFRRQSRRVRDGGGVVVVVVGRRRRRRCRLRFVGHGRGGTRGCKPGISVSGGRRRALDSGLWCARRFTKTKLSTR